MVLKSDVVDERWGNRGPACPGSRFAATAETFVPPACTAAVVDVAAAPAAAVVVVDDMLLAAVETRTWVRSATFSGTRRRKTLSSPCWVGGKETQEKSAGVKKTSCRRYWWGRESFLKLVPCLCRGRVSVFVFLCLFLLLPAEALEERRVARGGAHECE